MKNYVVGYGSLINSESQNVTGKTGPSVPVRLHNHVRAWSVVYDELKFCALGVEPKAGSSVSAVIFPVEDLEAFDRREHGYMRFQLSPELFSPWSALPIPNEARFWIYLPLPEKKGVASEKYLIWESYVDVILTGCLSIDEAFATDFIENTAGWDDRHWHRDRNQSEYLKHLTHFDPARVDQWLAKYSLK